MAEKSSNISGNIVDVISGRTIKGKVHIKDGIIEGIEETAKADNHFILPGLVDAHVHVESSMLVPAEFARLASVHGTVATVSDPHEIANVTGIRGVDYMIENGKKTPFYFNFGAPSCVPATAFETAGAHIGPDEVDQLLSRKEIKYLSEMMNWPGVLYNDKEVMAKIAIAKKHKKPVDGHAPGLKGEDARKYIAAGISTDHECFTKEEALDKLKYGMKILIREGSAAKNFDALIELIAEYPDKIMFCTDDMHPDALVGGHLDRLLRRSVDYGFKAIDAIRAVTVIPVNHYGLENGLLRAGDPADFIMVNDLKEFHVLQTWIKGAKVAENGKTRLEEHPSGFINRFDAQQVSPEDLEVNALSNSIKVIEAIDNQIITKHTIEEAKIENGKAVADTEKDILKIVVINRYKTSPPAVAFVRNFGIKKGAIASTVAHDSHNIIAVGADDESLKDAINLLIKNQGGISLVNDMKKEVLPLPVGGLMSTSNGYKVASQYENMDKLVKQMGGKLTAPYMTLSFLALLVIPELKLSDRGLFNGSEFKFVNLFD